MVVYRLRFKEIVNYDKQIFYTMVTDPKTQASKCGPTIGTNIRVVDLGPEWVRLAPNGRIQDFFRSCFSTF